MKAIATLATLLAIAAPLPAAAQQQTCQGINIPIEGAKLLCSKTFHASGTCNGGDQLATLVDSAGWPRTRLVPPWEPFAITIVGYQITLFAGRVQYLLAGNGYTPDIMGILGPNEPSRAGFFPAGTGFRLPPAGENAHVDLHYSCTSGDFQAYLTLYYVPP